MAPLSLLIAAISLCPHLLPSIYVTDCPLIFLLDRHKNKHIFSPRRSTFKIYILTSVHPLLSPPPLFFSWYAPSPVQEREKRELIVYRLTTSDQEKAAGAIAGEQTPPPKHYTQNTRNGTSPRLGPNPGLRQDPMEEKPSFERVQTLRLAGHAHRHVLLRILQSCRR